MSDTHRKVEPTKPKVDKPEQTLAERQATVGAAVKAKKTVEETKKEHDAIAKSATVNERLAKDGSSERLDVQMRHGEVEYTWGNFVPTRKVSDEDLKALETVKG